MKKSGKRFRILAGCEANILNDGSLDIEDEVLAELDFVIAGVHSQFKMNRAEMTERVCRAMRNPHVDILAHPTGRILKRRDEYEIDFDRVLKTAGETGTVLEINSYFERLDLNDENILRAKKAGLRMSINTDAHRADQLHQIAIGVAQARRGWAEKKDIINAWPVEKMLARYSAEARRTRPAELPPAASGWLIPAIAVKESAARQRVRRRDGHRHSLDGRACRRVNTGLVPAVSCMRTLTSTMDKYFDDSASGPIVRFPLIAVPCETCVMKSARPGMTDQKRTPGTAHSAVLHLYVAATLFDFFRYGIQGAKARVDKKTMKPAVLRVTA